TLLLLTNVEIKPTLKGVLWVVMAYVARWRVEEMIRFIKQSYKLEDIRLRSYNGLRNMTALVMACASFVSLQLGLQAKLQIFMRKLLSKLQGARSSPSCSSPRRPFASYLMRYI
ncbi:transposase, partial [bacterium]|nr:transposase [bacterium]